jgi:hypothetical protein
MLAYRVFNKMPDSMLKRITKNFSINFDETCKLHHHTGNLPCPWPDCPNGLKDDAFILVTPGIDKEKKIIRKNWKALNGEQRYSWDDTSFFSYFGVKIIIREEILRAFGAEPYPNGLIYHYTSINGFFNIISSNELWLTDYMYMNDDSEVNHGISLAKQILGEIKVDNEQKEEIVKTWQAKIENKLYDRICIACFSSESDSLSQWRGYGGADIGICLGFGFKEPFFLYDTEARLNRVIYDQNRQKEIFKILFHIFLTISDWDEGKIIHDYKGNVINTDEKENIVQKYAIRDLYEYIVYFKNESFSDEKEIRWVYSEDRTVLDSLQIDYAERLFRCKNNQIIPYTTSSSLFSMNPSNKYGSRGQEKSSLPLQEVIVGPQENIDLVLKGIREFLDENGFKSVVVRKSNIPFRPSR